MKIALLIIDAQNDFCNPDGALFVSGAVEDNIRLSKWIEDNKEGIGYIGCTMDSHRIHDIAHPEFWVDKDGNKPAPMTAISHEDVVNETWIPATGDRAMSYLEFLEADGAYVHVIWPEHCLIGSWGHALDDGIFKSINNWSRTTGNSYDIITKGVNPNVEHFGAFRAQMTIEGDKSTRFNTELKENLDKYDTVYIAGQAKSHCVANTVSQIFNEAPELAKKLVILEDTMSDVLGGPVPDAPSITFASLAQAIYDEAAIAGVRFSTTEEEID
jgi:nicotinamidase-related amidase